MYIYYINTNTKKTPDFTINFTLTLPLLLRSSIARPLKVLNIALYSAQSHSNFLLRFPLMDLEKEGGATDSCIEVDVGSSGEGPILEPYVGMEFDSEEAAKGFYVEYARREGFVVRVMQRRRSGIDGRTLARRLGCNKQGFSPNQKGAHGPEKKARPSAREGCNATILVKMEKSGKWVVTRFVKEHNHPLVLTSNGFSTEGDKDKKIEQLTMELEHQEQLCANYREKLLSFMKNVEDQTEELTAKIQVIVENVKKVESEVQKHSHHR